MPAALAAAFLLLQTAPQSPGPAPFDPQARVTEALAAIRPIAYHRDRLDWLAIEARARVLAAEAHDQVDMLPVYQSLVWYLDDNHSMLSPSDALYEGWTARYGDRRLLPDSPRRRQAASAFKERRDPEAQEAVLPNGRIVGVVVVPAVNQTPDTESAPYGNRLYAAVAAVAPRSCGYVVDVRGNTGGDVWPMITGLSDLVGDGLTFGTVETEGRIDAYAKLDQGRAVYTLDPEQPVMNRVENWTARPALATAPVAVLMDQATASSGEGVVLAFKGRPGARLFGETTYGVASSNTGVELSDGMELYITTGMMPDRNGAVYPQGIPADEPVATGPGDPNDPADAVEEAAMRWLATQPGCSA